MADRFLGSLMGTYIGHHYSANCQKPLSDKRPKLLYQSWLENAQSYMSPEPILWDANLAFTLPWLLYHHDDGQTRRHCLMDKTLASAPAAEVTAAHVLGNCLEWFMQSSLSHQYPRLSLYNHLQQQQGLPPMAIDNQVLRFMDKLQDPSFMTPLENVDYEPALTVVMLAINASLNYRENMVLAFASTQPVDPIPTLIGCLLGAWGGTSIIPANWMMALSNDCRQSITLVAQMLYRSWAGLSSINNSTIYEVTALDL